MANYLTKHDGKLVVVPERQHPLFVVPATWYNSKAAVMRAILVEYLPAHIEHPLDRHRVHVQLSKKVDSAYRSQQAGDVVHVAHVAIYVLLCLQDGMAPADVLAMDDGELVDGARALGLA